WREIVVDRTNSMFQRDKNLPCVISWSLGNEAYGGENFRAMKQAIRAVDKATPIHYEGVVHCPTFADVTDLDSNMYTPAAQVEQRLQQRSDKPVILCEYSHAMGNSCGGLHKYVALTEQYEQYQGGFIWDFIDQSIATRDCWGKPMMGYGGDFGDRPNDLAFCANGLVFGDRTLTPKLQLVKTCYQGAKILPDKTTVTITNKNLFTNLDRWEGRYTVARNGEELAAGSMTFAVEPQQTRSFSLPVKEYTLPGEYVVTVSLLLAADTRWEKRGYELAFGQYAYQVEEPPVPVRGKLRTENSEQNLGVYAETFSCIFSRTMGGMISCKTGDQELLTTIPKPNFWRAPTDNDKGNQMDFRLATWKTAGLYAKSKAFAFGEQDNCIWVEYTYRLPTLPETECFLRYTVSPEGSIGVSLRYPGTPGLPDMPEFSVMLSCDKRYHQLHWYGYGPNDCYADTVQGARLGIFHSTAADSLKPYIVPQECGNKCGV
ncbi:MAG: glycoside hydrolase family 2 TIM barrel-domain containing protein, partial [Angelakisella sp.]